MSSINLAVIFLILAILAGLVGFAAAGAVAFGAKVAFITCLVLFLVALCFDSRN